MTFVVSVLINEHEQEWTNKQYSDIEMYWSVIVKEVNSSINTMNFSLNPKWILCNKVHVYDQVFSDNCWAVFGICNDYETTQKKWIIL